MFVTLKKYLESRIKAVEKSIEVALASMDKRLDGMNEFRDTLKDQASRFITRDEVNAEIAAVNKQVKDLQLSKATMDGKASQTQALIILAIALAGLVLSAISLWGSNCPS